MSNELLDNIRIYEREATQLERLRVDIVSRIEGLLVTEIIPEVSSRLPLGYTISKDESYVEKSFDFPIQREFTLFLRLLYQGNPISLDTPQDKEIDGISRDLESKLSEFKEKYGFEVMVEGEPIGM